MDVPSYALIPRSADDALAGRAPPGLGAFEVVAPAAFDAPIQGLISAARGGRLMRAGA